MSMTSIIKRSGPCLEAVIIHPLSVAAVCDCRQLAERQTLLRRSQSAATTFLSGFFVVFFVIAAAMADDVKNPRIIESFDKDWRFLQADPADGQGVALDDSQWQTLNVPHDWSIAGPFAATNKTGGAGAFLPSGVCWYRKHFSLPNDLTSKRVFIEFDGVMQNSQVWLNGQPLGSRPSGYVSFSYELTPYLKSAGDNVLVVRCDTSAQPASRWYSGAGI